MGGKGLFRSIKHQMPACNKIIKADTIKIGDILLILKISKPGEKNNNKESEVIVAGR